MPYSVKHLSIGVAAVFLIALVGWRVANGDSDDVVISAPSDVSPVVVTPVNDEKIAPTPLSALSYADGTYSATGSYTYPKGQNALGVTVTLKDDVIADVSITEMATDPISQKYQDQFVAEYTTLVVGKNIDDVQLSKISGASLTPNGFNDALNAIKSQAEITS